MLIPTPNTNDSSVAKYIQWAPVSGTNGYGYEVWLDTSVDFSAPQKYTETASIFTPTDSLTINTVYYWKWRAIFSTGPGDWSSTMAFIPRLIFSP